jgi:hypothetical protein
VDKGAFLNGTVMGSPAEARVEIWNPGTGGKIILDMTDIWHPKRTSETGEVEEAGNNHEVWVDFEWSGPQDGDFFHPFSTLAAAYSAVAPGGVIRVMPGRTPETVTKMGPKSVTIVAPIGGVVLGAAP